jgi:hypothetical protein
MKIKAIVLALVFACFSKVAQAQCYTSLNAGFDPFSQGFYAGIDHQIHDYSIGFDLGTSLGAIHPAEYLSFTLDNNYYFGSKNKFDLKTWHINARLTYETIYKELTNKPKRFSMTPAIGKSFNLDRHWAINIDLGLNIQLSNSGNNYLVGAGENYDFNNAILPDLRIELKYQL